MDKNEKIITISQAKKQQKGLGNKKKIIGCIAGLLFLLCIILFAAITQRVR